MIDSTNPRVMANNIRALHGRPVGTVVEANASGNGYTTSLAKLKVGDSKYKVFNCKDITGTLEAGQTSLTLSDSAIKSNSTYEIFTDVYGLSPTAVTVSTGSIVLTFASQVSDVSVKVRVS